MIGKYNKLLENIKAHEKLALAFSGGVDSSFLLHSAIEAIGGENVLAVTISTSMYPRKEREFAEKLAKSMGVKHIILEVDESKITGLVENSMDRCYFCKKEIFKSIREVSNANGIDIILDGSNFDDLNDFRPGMRALEELNIRSPLKEIEMTKREIRSLSKQFNIETWDFPSMACLASRIPYGKRITAEKLDKIERGESYLNDLGYWGIRLRYHDNIARLELAEEDFHRFIREDRHKVVEYLKELGFDYISLDLEGYVMGSMNKNI